MAKFSKLPKWLLYLVIALPIGILLGAPLPLLYFLSEKRDWGKTYENYSDFVSAHLSWGIEYSLICAGAVWLILMFLSWAYHRKQHKKASAHQASVAPDRE